MACGLRQRRINGFCGLRLHHLGALAANTVESNLPSCLHLIGSFLKWRYQQSDIGRAMPVVAWLPGVANVAGWTREMEVKVSLFLDWLEEGQSVKPCSACSVSGPVGSPPACGRDGVGHWLRRGGSSGAAGAGCAHGVVVHCAILGWPPAGCFHHRQEWSDHQPLRQHAGPAGAVHGLAGALAEQSWPRASAKRAWCHLRPPFSMLSTRWCGLPRGRADEGLCEVDCSGGCGCSGWVSHPDRMEPMIENLPITVTAHLLSASSLTACFNFCFKWGQQCPIGSNLPFDFAGRKFGNVRFKYCLVPRTCAVGAWAARYESKTL